MLRHVFDYIKTNKWLLIIIIPGFLLQMLVMMPSGTNFCIADDCGMRFWGVNSHDGMWHLEIAGAAFRQMPFIVPTYAGATLSGYNILLDYILYLVSLVGISPVVTLFKLIPPIWFVCYTVMLITLGRSIHNSPRFIGFLLFFGYFGGHLGYLLQLYHNRSIFLGDQSFALQSGNMLLNTQFALSLPFLLYICYAIKERLFTTKHIINVAICFFFIIGLKFYGAVVAGVCIGFYLLEQLLTQHKRKSIFLQGCLFAAVLGIGVIIFYNPFAESQTGNVLMLSPFATVHATIEELNMVYLPDLVHARYYLYTQGFGPKLLLIELFSTLLYVIIHFGTRVAGFIYVFQLMIQKKLNRFNFYVSTTIIIATSLTVLFIQHGDWWNTVQFSYYAIFLSNILVAQAVYSWSKIKNVVVTGFIVLILTLSVPFNLQTIRLYTLYTADYIPQYELKALDFLRKLPDGVVFNSFPLNKKNDYPFLDYENTGYIAAFTNKQTYLNHFGPLNILGTNYAERRAKVEANSCSVLRDVKYIYYNKMHKIDFLLACAANLHADFDIIYDREGVRIYERIN